MVPLVVQEEEASPLAPKKVKIESSVGRTRTRKLKKKNTPPPQVPKPILEADVKEEEDEKMDNIPLSQRTL